MGNFGKQPCTHIRPLCYPCLKVCTHHYAIDDKCWPCFRNGTLFLRPMNRYVCIHGHFYQPPRENAWLEVIEQQEGAAPYHDWNERISAECYAPNAASRILDQEDRIIHIVNNYSNISFNFGPTLLSWMERHDRDAYAGILEADRLSMERCGHGNALAQVYNHIIMPLATTRDKETQIIWGLADFAYRFNRKPEGIWLAETAVDLETLDLCAKHGIQFTILAPRQIEAVRLHKVDSWTEVHEDSVDTGRPYLVETPSGRTITVFVYHGELSRGVAFNGLLNSGRMFADSILAAFPKDQETHLVNLATDGESYGHHHRNGDMALASCLDFLDQEEKVEVINYATFLEKYPATAYARIRENSSWSCVHGIERWRSNCGCQDGAHADYHQKWRKPLRDALDWLKALADTLYEKEVGTYCPDPWMLRNKYIRVILNRDQQEADTMLDDCLPEEVDEKTREFIIRLLEMQRNAMLMFTSCAWFFDDVSRIETLQVLQYADRVIQIAEGETKKEILHDFLKRLSQAPVNAPGWEDAAELYVSKIRSKRLDLNSVAMHYAAASLFEHKPEKLQLFNYTYENIFFERFESASHKLSVGHIRVRSRVTFYERPFYFAALHLGQQHIVGHFANAMDVDAFETMHLELRDAFRQHAVSDMLRIMQKYFGEHRFSFEDLFRDEQRKVLSMLMENDLELARISYRKIYDRSYDLVNRMRSSGMSIPVLLKRNMETVINNEFIRFFQGDNRSVGRLDFLAEETTRWKLQLEKGLIANAAGDWLDRVFADLSERPYDMDILDLISKVMLRLHDVEVRPGLFRAQNRCFNFGKAYLNKTTTDLSEEAFLRWQIRFKGLAAQLGLAF